MAAEPALPTFVGAGLDAESEAFVSCPPEQPAATASQHAKAQIPKVFFNIPSCSFCM